MELVSMPARYTPFLADWKFSKHTWYVAKYDCMQQTSALHVCCQQGHASYVPYLLQQGADILARDEVSDSVCQNTSLYIMTMHL